MADGVYAMVGHEMPFYTIDDGFEPDEIEWPARHVGTPSKTREDTLGHLVRHMRIRWDTW